MATGKTPDYDLCVMDKTTKISGRVGVAWKNADGRIGIVLNPCIVLTSDSNLVIALFVKKPYQQQVKPGSYKNQDEMFNQGGEREEEAPF